MVMKYPNPWFERSSHSGHLWNQAWNLKRFSCLCPWSFSSYASSAQQWTCPSLLLATRQEGKNGLITGEKNTVWVGILLMFVCLFFGCFEVFLVIHQFSDRFWVFSSNSLASRCGKHGFLSPKPEIRCRPHRITTCCQMRNAAGRTGCKNGSCHFGKNFGNGWRRNSDLMWSVFVIG